MSIFTNLSNTEIQRFLDNRQLTLRRYLAASEGIENSNFFVTAIDAQQQQHELVLTVLEQQSFHEADWFVALLTQLAKEALPVPVPIGPLQRHQGKPVLIAPRLPGRHPLQPNTSQAYTLGQLLARLHSSRFHLPSPAASERDILQQLSHYCSKLPGEWLSSAKWLLNEWDKTANKQPFKLIHADLFRDNCLFVGNKLSGVLDFYHACHDLPVYDLAVALNDWTLDTKARRLPAMEEALLAGYERISPLPTPELLPLAQAVASLRFWLSRLAANDATLAAHAGRGSKPPEEFAAKLALRWQQLNASSQAGY